MREDYLRNTGLLQLAGFFEKQFEESEAENIEMD